MNSNSNNKPRVSVIMSVYKEKIEWIRESVNSILDQTFKEFEFIIVCDAPDNKDAIDCLNEFAEKDKRIKLFVNEKNEGLTKSLNRGLRESLGYYIARIDADDVSLCDRLEKQVRFMDTHPDVVASGTSAFYWDGKRVIRRTHRYSSSKILRSMIIFDSPIYHPSAFFRRIIDGTPVMYNEEFKYSQDYALWISLIGSNYKLSNIDKPLIKYRVSEQQISTSKHDEQQQYAIRNLKESVKKLSLGLADKEVELLADILRKPNVRHSKTEVEELIIRFMGIIRKREDLDYNAIASYLTLVYITRLSKEESLKTSLIRVFKMNRKTHHFSFYNIMSLLGKYIRSSQ